MRSVELSLKGVLALASAVNTVFDTRGLNSLRLNEGIPVACVRNCGKSKGKQRREKANRRQSVTLYQAWTCPTLVVPEPRERIVPSAALFAVHEEPFLARLTPLSKVGLLKQLNSFKSDDSNQLEKILGHL